MTMSQTGPNRPPAQLNPVLSMPHSRTSITVEVVGSKRGRRWTSTNEVELLAGMLLPEAGKLPYLQTGYRWSSPQICGPWSCMRRSGPQRRQWLASWCGRVMARMRGKDC